ncbi:hypothetical protein K227x_41130 [Rubripirellula lacrimiformis]|uniref:Uncharacterized protein n=1 Tax=Rubripirellula lacrimiformis TaxID=1930273 RepID=A0A517NEZ8_9BACT|nr:hypothetical protein [Rubripirellula lacrimiformis]QDT05710.1 hypothetical protein K227x_41130 [Rubripirellula lacrimiformis]
MFSRLIAVATLASLMVSFAEARNPYNRYRTSMSRASRATPQRMATPPAVAAQRSNALSTTATSILQSPARMNEVYGPSILVRDTAADADEAGTVQ